MRRGRSSHEANPALLALYENATGEASGKSKPPSLRSRRLLVCLPTIALIVFTLVMLLLTVRAHEDGRGVAVQRDVGAFAAHPQLIPAVSLVDMAKSSDNVGADKGGLLDSDEEPEVEASDASMQQQLSIPNRTDDARDSTWDLPIGLGAFMNHTAPSTSVLAPGGPVGVNLRIAASDGTALEDVSGTPDDSVPSASSDEVGTPELAAIEAPSVANDTIDAAMDSVAEGSAAAEGGAASDLVGTSVGEGEDILSTDAEDSPKLATSERPRVASDALGAAVDSGAEGSAAADLVGASDGEGEEILSTDVEDSRKLATSERPRVANDALGVAVDSGAEVAAVADIVDASVGEDEEMLSSDEEDSAGLLAFERLRATNDTLGAAGDLLSVADAAFAPVDASVGEGEVLVGRRWAGSKAHALADGEQWAGSERAGMAAEIAPEGEERALPLEAANGAEEAEEGHEADASEVGMAGAVGVVAESDGTIEGIGGITGKDSDALLVMDEGESGVGVSATRGSALHADVDAPSQIDASVRMDTGAAALEAETVDDASFLEQRSDSWEDERLSEELLNALPTTEPPSSSPPPPPQPPPPPVVIAVPAAAGPSCVSAKKGDAPMAQCQGWCAQTAALFHCPWCKCRGCSFCEGFVVAR